MPNGAEVLAFRGLHAGGRPKVDLRKRYEEKIAPPNEQGCRMWTGGASKRRTTEDRVGKILRDGVQVQAHIIMWEFAYNEYPKRQIKPTVCGHWLCMEPTHWSMVRDRTLRTPMTQIRLGAALRAQQQADEKAQKKESKRKASIARKSRKFSQRGKRRWGTKKTES